ncbi:MAG: hypothetical protein LCH90_19040 [Proteobacteria bacterium]|nr:hypothetical protein [Pseudomonadota bacterium]
MSISGISKREGKRLILKIIREMQEELDAFFRAKKAKMVKLSPEDILYLEVMLAQAIGSHRESPPAGGDDDDGRVGLFAYRFLKDFFTLKTKPQVQVREDTFKLVQRMVDHTLNRALERAQDAPSHSESSASCSDTTEDDADADDETSASMSSDEEVRQEPIDPNSVFGRTRTHPVRINSMLFAKAAIGNGKGNGWLKRPKTELLDIESKTPESPLSRAKRQTVPSAVKTSDKKPDKNRKLPIKKRKSIGGDAVVPTITDSIHVRVLV